MLPLLLAVLLLAGCAQRGGEAAAAPSSAADAPADELQGPVDRGDGSAPVRWTLRCGNPAAGTHPQAQAACDHLTGLDDPFAPLPGDVACTEVYGGPQTAHVTGRWGREPVDLELSRVDGCRIAQWDDLVPLVPAVEGMSPVD